MGGRGGEVCNFCLGANRIHHQSWNHSIQPIVKKLGYDVERPCSTLKFASAMRPEMITQIIRKQFFFCNRCVCNRTIISPYNSCVSLARAQKVPYVGAEKLTQTFSGQSISRTLRVMDVRAEIVDVGTKKRVFLRPWW